MGSPRDQNWFLAVAFRGLLAFSIPFTAIVLLTHFTRVDLKVTHGLYCGWDDGGFTLERCRGDTERPDATFRIAPGRLPKRRVTYWIARGPGMGFPSSVNIPSWTLLLPVYSLLLFLWYARSRRRLLTQQLIRKTRWHWTLAALISVALFVALYPAFIEFGGALSASIGFGILNQRYGVFGFSTVVAMGATLIAVFPCSVVYHLLRWKYVPNDGRSCLRCDYDLTGNTSGRCPECGEASSMAATTSIEPATVG